jgi:cytochrome b involved in lipid metabolism
MTQKQTYVIAGLVVIVGLIAGYTLYSRSNGYKLPTQTQTTEGTVESTKYTLDQVATHKDETSCWTTIDGNVYDLTSWISQHPGGKDTIKMICGKDGSAAFHNQHGEEQRTADLLASFKIGTLAQ